MVGVIIGLALPGVGRSVGVLDTMFVDLIKTMITPVIFCTIVIAVGSARGPATDDRPVDGHVVSSGIAPERDPILEMRSAPARAVGLKGS